MITSPAVLNIIKSGVPMLRSPLQHPVMPITPIKLSLKIFQIRGVNGMWNFDFVISLRGCDICEQLKLKGGLRKSWLEMELSKIFRWNFNWLYICFVCLFYICFVRGFYDVEELNGLIISVYIILRRSGRITDIFISVNKHRCRYSRDSNNKYGI